MNRERKKKLRRRKWWGVGPERCRRPNVKTTDGYILCARVRKDREHGYKSEPHQVVYAGCWMDDFWLRPPTIRELPWVNTLSGPTSRPKWNQIEAQRAWGWPCGFSEPWARIQRDDTEKWRWRPWMQLCCTHSTHCRR